MDKKRTFLYEDWWPDWAHVGHPTLWLVGILLLTAVLRVYGIYHLSPPGLEHDEVANWLIDRAILAGNHAVYFAEAYGHEAGFHYLQAAFVAMLGDHALALRLPAAFTGILLVAVHYSLIRRLFGTTTALISAAILAVLFWSVFYSRLGLRAISLPLVSGFALYAWWKAWPPAGEQTSGRPALWFALTGLLAGATLYTYMAARAVPIFFALFMLYLLLFQREQFKERWRELALFWLVLLLTALPLIVYLRSNPSAEFRITEVDAPLRALLAGDLRPVLLNAARIGGMFGFAGDPLWRQNVAGRPVLGPLLALCFYGGLFLAILRFKDSRYAFLLIWLAAAAVPSLVTVDAPSSIRLINGLLVVTVFPVLVINMLARLSTGLPWFSTKLAYLLGLLLILAHIWWTVDGIFHRWPQNEEVQFVWQAALTDMARYLDSSPEAGPAAIGGWSPATMDAPTIALSMRRDDLALRFFGSDSTTEPVSTVIIPRVTDDSSADVRVLRPAIRDLVPEIEAQIVTWAGEGQDMGTFILYELSVPAEIKGSVQTAERFDDQLELIAYKLPVDLTQCAREGCSILTYWHVLVPVEEPRRFFLHALSGGELVAQHDGLDAPAMWWRAGDLLVQEHHLPPAGEDDIDLRLGVYDPQTGRRLLRPDGLDYFPLQ